MGRVQFTHFVIVRESWLMPRLSTVPIRPLLIILLSSKPKDFMLDLIASRYSRGIFRSLKSSGLLGRTKCVCEFATYSPLHAQDPE